jgi:hypothetical protein
MALDVLPAPNDPAVRLAPVEPRLAPLFCLVLLAGACALASFALACATPFAAFAVIAAALMPWRRALPIVAAAWLINQAIGFGALGYPADANTVAWGLAIGVAALAATLASAAVLRTMPRVATPLVLSLALLAAFAVYELVLFASTPVLGGSGMFAAAIVGRLAVLSGLWVLGLVAACEVARFLLATRRRRLPS